MLAEQRQPRLGSGTAYTKKRTQERVETAADELRRCRVTTHTHTHTDKVCLRRGAACSCRNGVQRRILWLGDYF